VKFPLVSLLLFDLCVDEMVGSVAESCSLVNWVNIGTERKYVIGVGLRRGMFSDVTLCGREDGF
jgi:hypothetical protein